MFWQPAPASPAVFGSFHSNLERSESGLCYWISDQLGSERSCELSHDGQGPWYSAGVKCPHSPLTGTSPSALERQRRNKRERELWHQPTTPQLLIPFET